MSLFKRVRAEADPGPRKMPVRWTKAAAARTFRRKRVYGRMPGELKFHDVDLDDTVVASAGAITPSINLIAQGVTEVTRVGRKCTITNVNWRMNYSMPQVDAQATPGAGDILRIILYVDKQANKATAAITDILESADYQSFRNLANVSRFNLLVDKTVGLNYMGLASDGTGVVSQGLMIRPHDLYRKLSLPIEFSAGTGAITEITSNNLGVLLISKNGLCGFNSKFRLRFSDGS